jgi:A/G-specific adenine glycosylase
MRESTVTSSTKQIFSDSVHSAFHHRLLRWYDTHARDLPWREDRDPYRVWVSEIMLQQTRVAVVIAHYHEFLRRFPTVEKLAAAREASVLAAWSGLGYYRRARMLHAAAKVVSRDLGGKFPMTSGEWRALPGIGRYTAAAIASIAFGEAVAVVDGNVERVLQRVSGRRLVGEELWSAAEELLDRDRGHANPGDFNQAMMELGATVCTPRAPACLTCPVVELCATRGELARSSKTAPQKKCEIHYTLHCRDGEVFLVQRDRGARLMAGMWELPEVAEMRAGAKQVPPARSATRRNDRTKNYETSENDRTNGNASATETVPELCFTLRHSITVTDYTVRVWRGHPLENRAGEWVTTRQLPRLALTGLARKILRQAGILAVQARASNP